MTGHILRLSDAADREDQVFLGGLPFLNSKESTHPHASVAKDDYSFGGFAALTVGVAGGGEEGILPSWVITGFPKLGVMPFVTISASPLDGVRPNEGYSLSLSVMMSLPPIQCADTIH